MKIVKHIKEKLAISVFILITINFISCVFFIVFFGHMVLPFNHFLGYRDFVKEVSCVFEVDTNDSADSREIINNKVKVNIEVARTLSDLAIINEKLIVFAQWEHKQHYLKKILIDIIENQQIIKNRLNEFAKQKLILLPTKYNTFHVDTLKNKDNTDLSHMVRLLKDEVKKVERLSKITKDWQFKSFLVSTLEPLNSTIHQIQKNHKIINH